jgi:hypothetical protein
MMQRQEIACFRAAAGTTVRFCTKTVDNIVRKRADIT